jgi:hypothetical protein
MKNRLVTLAAGLVLLAVVGKFVTVPAIAQAVRAALVRDIDNPARNAVQFELYGYYGSNDYYVPAGKTLVIEDVAFVTPYGNAGTFGIVTTLNGSTVVHYFAPVGYSASGIATNGSWFGGRTTRIYAAAGSRVYVQTNGSVGTGQLDFSGYLLDASY